MCLDPISRRRLLQLTAASAVLTAAGGTYPDNFDRIVSAVDAARGARERGLKAIVLKGGAFETVTRG